MYETSRGPSDHKRCLPPSQRSLVQAHKKSFTVHSTLSCTINDYQCTIMYYHVLSCTINDYQCTFIAIRFQPSFGTPSSFLRRSIFSSNKGVERQRRSTGAAKDCGTNGPNAVRICPTKKPAVSNIH